MRVSLVTTRITGGSGKQVAMLAHGLRDRGVEVTLWTGRPGPGEAHEPLKGLAPHDLPGMRRRPSLADPAIIAQLHAEWSTRPPDVVHTHLSKAGVVGRLAARGLVRTRTCHTYHGVVLEEHFGRLGGGLIARVERGLARITDALVAVCPQDRDRMVERGVGTPARWHVIRVGVEPVRATQEDRNSIRGSFQIPPTAKVIGFIGRLVTIKGVDLLARTWDLVARTRPETHLLVVGDGEGARSLGSFVNRDRVHLAGWVRDVTPFLAAMDVVVNTSRNEGTPLGLIEALTAGIPVVAPCVGGVPDILRSNRKGKIVTRDPQAIAKAIDACIDLHERPLTSQRTEEFSARYSPQRYVDETLQLYESLLQHQI